MRKWNHWIHVTILTFLLVLSGCSQDTRHTEEISHKNTPQRNLQLESMPHIKATIHHRPIDTPDDSSAQTNFTNNKAVSGIQPREIVILDSFDEKEIVKEKVGVDSHEMGLFTSTLEVGNVAPDELSLNITFKNLSGKDQQLSFGSGQQFDFYVLNDQEEEVYCWSHDKAFIAVIIDLDLADGEQLSFEETWDLKDNKGEYLPSGQYTIIVEIRASLKDQNELQAKRLHPDDTMDMGVILVR